MPNPTDRRVPTLSVRTDLGGRIAALPTLASLDVAIERPVIILAGISGCGKSTLLAALRHATGLVGSGIGRPWAFETLQDPLSIPDEADGPESKSLDLGRLAIYARSREELYQFGKPRTGSLRANAAGVLDVRRLGWRGQRIYLHDGRRIDGESIRDCGSDMIGSMRRAHERDNQSHGQALDARLRYAAACGIGLFDLEDAFDHPPAPQPRHGSYQHPTDKALRVAQAIYAATAGRQAGERAHRPQERWLLLDEPETGLSPDRLIKTMALLIEHSGEDRLQVICATQSPLLVADLAGHPKVQVIDLDHYRQVYDEARRLARDPAALSSTATAEAETLARDFAAAEAPTDQLRNWSIHRSLAVPRS